MKSRFILFGMFIFSGILSAQHFNTQAAQVSRQLQTNNEMMTMRNSLDRNVSNIDNLEKEEIKMIKLRNEVEDLEQELKTTDDSKQKVKIQKKIDKVKIKLADAEKIVAQLASEVEADKKRLKDKTSHNAK
ncbi:MAG: hypothetical protein JNJ52_09665 [Flavobacterium sp.]|nr:hypothetical protein [Flavobacterium sp.]